MIKKVQFTANHPPYIEGDVAGFNTEEADALIASGVAKAITGAANKMVDAPPAAKAKGRPRKK